MHRAVLGPRPRPTGGHEPDPFKQTRNGPLTGTKRPKIISRSHSPCPRTGRQRRGPFIRLCLAPSRPESRNPKSLESVSVSPCPAGGRRLSLPSPSLPVGELQATRRPERQSPATPARCAVCAPAPCTCTGTVRPCRGAAPARCAPTPARLHATEPTQPPLRGARGRRPETGAAPARLRERDRSLRAPLYSGLDIVFRDQMCISGHFCISGLYYFRVARLKLGTFSSIRVGPWAEGSARGPARPGPKLILGRADPKLNVSGLFGPGPGRAGRPECTPIPVPTTSPYGHVVA
jgi:hypothetical protein